MVHLVGRKSTPNYLLVFVSLISELVSAVPVFSQLDEEATFTVVEHIRMDLCCRADTGPCEDCRDPETCPCFDGLSCKVIVDQGDQGPECCKSEVYDTEDDCKISPFCTEPYGCEPGFNHWYCCPDPGEDHDYAMYQETEL